MDFALEPAATLPLTTEPITVETLEMNEEPHWSSPALAGGSIDAAQALAHFGHYVDRSFDTSEASERVMRVRGDNVVMAVLDGLDGEEEQSGGAFGGTVRNGAGETRSSHPRRRRSKDEPCDCLGCRLSRAPKSESSTAVK